MSKNNNEGSSDATFKKVKSVVFGKNDKEFFDDLTKKGLLGKDFSDLVKRLLQEYLDKNSIGESGVFTKAQEQYIQQLLGKQIIVSSEEETTVTSEDEKEEPMNKEEENALSSMLNFGSVQ